MNKIIRGIFLVIFKTIPTFTYLSDTNFILGLFFTSQDIAEILLKLSFNTSQSIFFMTHRLLLDIWQIIFFSVVNCEFTLGFE